MQSWTTKRNTQIAQLVEEHILKIIIQDCRVKRHLRYDQSLCCSKYIRTYCAWRVNNNRKITLGEVECGQCGQTLSSITGVAWNPQVIRETINRFYMGGHVSTRYANRPNPQIFLVKPKGFDQWGHFLIIKLAISNERIVKVNVRL